MLDEVKKDLKKLQEDMNVLFDNVRERHGKRREFKEAYTPLIDIEDRNNDLIVSVEMPGISKEDIDIKINEDSIEVKADRKIEKKIEREGYFKNERKYKSFYRKFSLPLKVIPEKATHTYEKGILKIIIPKEA